MPTILHGTGFLRNTVGNRFVSASAAPPPVDEASIIAWLTSLPGGVWMSRPAAIRRKNQGQTRACNGHSAATSMEGRRYMQGMDVVPISAWDIYARACGGIDQGSFIHTALTMLEQDGAAPEALVPYGLIDPNKIPPLAVASRTNYRVTVGSPITTYEELISAYYRRTPVNLAVFSGGESWQERFLKLDAEGVPTLFSGPTGPCDHAQCGMLGLKWSQRWGLLGQIFNSWGDQVQDGGCYWAPLKQLVKYDGFEAYLTGDIVDAPDDPTRPPDPID